MATTKQPKRRVFEKKLRGRKAFARDNAGLISNLTGYHGKAKNVPDSAIELAKGTVTGLAGIRAASKADAKRTPWATLKRFVCSFDCIHNTQIWEAFEVWTRQNPAFQKLNPRKRLAVAASVISKMLEFKARQAGVVPSAQRFDETNGTNLMAAVATVKDYQELISTIRSMAASQKVLEVEQAKQANKHYEHGMR